MMRKPGAMHNIGIDLDERAIFGFEQGGGLGRRYAAMSRAERLAVLSAIMAVKAE